MPRGSWTRSPEGALQSAERFRLRAERLSSSLSEFLRGVWAPARLAPARLAPSAAPGGNLSASAAAAPQLPQLPPLPPLPPLPQAQKRNPTS